MTLLDTAGELTAALSTVDSVTGYNTMPSAPKVGDAWVLMGRAERAPRGGYAFTVAWRVRVAVPANDELGALTLFSELWPLLFVTLIEAGAEVDAFAPVVIPMRGGDVWAYEIICRTGDN